MTEEEKKKDAAFRERMLKSFKSLSSACQETDPERRFLRGISCGLLSGREVAGGYGCHAEDVSEYKTASAMKRLRKSMGELINLVEGEIGKQK